MPTSEKMLTVSEVAQLLHVHPNTVRNWSDSGLIKTYRLGYRQDRRFRQQDLDSFLRNNTLEEPNRNSI
jgi:excisionase family DNA binding protein